MSNIKIHEVGTRERKNLDMVSIMLNYLQSNYDCHVANTYFDLGQDWKWTTIVAGYSDSWQMLNPRQMDAICNATSLEDLVVIALRLYDEQKDLLERRTA